MLNKNVERIVGELEDAETVPQPTRAELKARIAKLEYILGIAGSTIRQLERHAPGSANGTLDLISAALETK